MRGGRERAVAGRDEIVQAASRIGVAEGWRAVTIRAVARELGYTSPVLYEHFRDKEELLTQIAIEALGRLEGKLTEDLPDDPCTAVSVMIERYWTFMIEHTQLYRLMNGMDGVPINRDAVNQSAGPLCRVIGEAVRPLAGKDATEGDAAMIADELWALLHGMATLYLERSAPFDLPRVTRAAFRLLAGAGRR